MNIKKQELLPYLYLIKGLQEVPNHDAWLYPRKEYFKKLLGVNNVLNSTLNKSLWQPLMDNPNVNLDDIQRVVEEYASECIEWDETEYYLNDHGAPHPEDSRPSGHIAFYYLVECVRQEVIPEKKLYTLCRGFGDTIQHNGVLPMSKGFYDMMENIREGRMSIEYYMKNRKHLVVMEHRIPVRIIAEMALNDCLNLRDMFLLSQNKLKDNFCLVTKEEDNLLDPYKKSMPKDESDRYDKVGIEIVGKADIKYRHNPRIAFSQGRELSID